MSGLILPGSVLGVLGSGQLGRMFAIAARRLGYRVHVFSPDDDTPTGQVADVEIRADYNDLDRVAEFARSVSVMTFEFENVPAATAETAAKFCPVRPGGHVLYTSQNRLREKTYLSQRGLPVTPFRAVTDEASLLTAIQELGLPAVLKTADWGYDGKGQSIVRTVEEAKTAFQKLGVPTAILEGFIDFYGELSVIGVRGVDGSFASYGPFGNTHQNHILDVTVCPALLPEFVAGNALEIARNVLEVLDVVGVLCVEFFLTKTLDLLINETAPRPHNSGHLTLDAHVSCQFEQQVRSICGLPLGSTQQHAPAAMANLLGDVWTGAEPDWSAGLADSNVKLHLYGKREARPGRKMGHLNAMAGTAKEAEQLVRQARSRLSRSPS